MKVLFFPCDPRWICAAFLCVGLAAAVNAQRILSGNENKVDLTTGAPRVITPDGPDSISLLDFSKFPPTVQHLENVPNTVIGPPSNIAITPNNSLALIADSVKVDPHDPSKWVPNSQIHLLDLESRPPRIIGSVQAGQQPSGLSITRDGKFALVANRADGTVTLLRIAGKEVWPVAPHPAGSGRLPGGGSESFRRRGPVEMPNIGDERKAVLEAGDGWGGVCLSK